MKEGKTIILEILFVNENLYTPDVIRDQEVKTLDDRNIGRYLYVLPRDYSECCLRWDCNIHGRDRDYIDILTGRLSGTLGDTHHLCGLCPCEKEPTLIILTNFFLSFPGDDGLLIEYWNYSAWKMTHGWNERGTSHCTSQSH